MQDAGFAVQGARYTVQPDTVNREPYTQFPDNPPLPLLGGDAEARNLIPETRYPKPETLNRIPSTRNPVPDTSFY
jgi:hypothetical protein